MKDSKLLLRTAILLQLQAAMPIALPLKTLLCGLGLAGFALTEAQLLKELYYLEKKEFISPKGDEISLGDVRYALELAAIEYLEKRGF